MYVYKCVIFISVLLIRWNMLGAVYDLAICAIFQDEAPFMKEWIEFHKLQGVQHFYLYDNNSRDNYIEVLQPYIDAEEVTLVQWPYTYKKGKHSDWIKIQTRSYMDCIRSNRKNINWLAIIDLDEFLFCSHEKTLPEFLKAYSGYGGLCVNWVMFGTSNVEDILPGICMIELLVSASEQNNPDNLFVKSIVQPKFVKDCHSAHFCIYKPPYFAVSPNFNPIFSDRSEINDISNIRINHYWSRTESHFFLKKIASRQNRRSSFVTSHLKKLNVEYNRTCDTTILKHVAKLHNAMGFEPAITP